MIDLARRAVACKGWRWMPGMRWTNDPDQPIRNDGEEGRHEEDQTPPRYGIPDLSDPATLGCLLALVREAWPGAWAEPNGPGEGADEAERRAWWAVYASGRGRIATGATEAEALVAALEAA